MNIVAGPSTHMKHQIPVWRMVERALQAHGGKATNLQLRDWILQRWPDVPKGTITCQRIICTVNQPSRVQFPENSKPRLANARYDLMYMPARGHVVSYDPKIHGLWEIARVGGKLAARLAQPGGQDAPGPAGAKRREPVDRWILVHSKREFHEKAQYQSPAQELIAEFEPGMLWNWRLPQPMRPDPRKRSVLLGWNGLVIGEATASITRKIQPSARRKGSNFAFVLHRYSLLDRPIPYSHLRLGDRASNHRSLIKLSDAGFREYLRRRRSQPAPQAKTEKRRTEVITLSEGDHGQGFGLTPAQRTAVANHGMEMAKRELTERGFDHVDVSQNSSYDLSATADGRHYYVEVKGTTGAGKSIFLTANEVDLHQEAYPHNILILIHGIRLSGAGKASGGRVHFEKGWKLQDQRLKAVTYRYIRDA